MMIKLQMTLSQGQNLRLEVSDLYRLSIELHSILWINKSIEIKLNDIPLY